MKPMTGTAMVMSGLFLIGSATPVAAEMVMGSEKGMPSATMDSGKQSGIAQKTMADFLRQYSKPSVAMDKYLQYLAQMRKAK